MPESESQLNKPAINKAGKPSTQMAGKPSTQMAGKYSRTIFWIIVAAAAIVLIGRNIGVIGNALKVAIGFGAVVLVHEFGHFIVAKLSGIKVEAFSIFMPPTLLGVRKAKSGFRFRFLPRSPDKEMPAEDDATEYRVGLIPFGGFVKMLGQDDIGPAKASDDPHSFANKSVGVRMGVITAGVAFNTISAIIVFMIVFLVGIKLPPPVVGGVIPDSPAAQAGIKAGDEIIEIAGKTKDLDFSNISIAAALSDANEAVRLKVRHEGGSIENYAIAAKQIPSIPLKDFGILLPMSLNIAQVSDPNKLYSKTGFLPGDKVVAVNGKEVQHYWELEETVVNSLVPEITLSVERNSEMVESKVKLEVPSIDREIESEADLSHIYSMIPRLRIKNVLDKPLTTQEKFVSLLGNVKKSTADTDAGLASDDIILAIGDIENPTYMELREVIEEFWDEKPDKENKHSEIPVKVLRKNSAGVEETLTIQVVPRWSKQLDKPLLGITAPVLDFEHPVVAKSIDTEGGPAKLEIPRGARITAVDGVGVANFYDIIREIRKHPGERITIDWRLDEETAGDAALSLDTDKDSITVKSTFAELIPFEDLRRVYKADGPVNAIGMGYRKTLMFITQTYLTLKRLVGGLVSPKNLMGPIGIIALSYQVVTGQPLIYYIYLLGLISAVIAVFNFLPLPPLDGGLIALLLIEKIKGSALSERIQGVIAYTGWVLIGALFLYVTFNDIVRVFFS
jgi:regulator of sigma E protease